MPWNVQGGGGPWGPSGGGNGPWGGGQKGPDIEDLLRRGQDRMRGLLPGGPGAKGLNIEFEALCKLNAEVAMASASGTLS